MSDRYIIINVECSNCAVDLLGGTGPCGTVSGYKRLNNSHQKWRIVKFDGPDNFVFESEVARNFYATTYIQADGVPISSSPNPTIWIVEWVPGSNAYHIKSRDGKYAWFLLGSQDSYSIILKPADQVAKETRAQWKFERI